jgi:hypothetical protein
MASFWYTKGIAYILGTNNVDFANDTIKATLIDSADYVADKDADDFYDDVTGAGRISTGTLTTVSVTPGVATITIDADDLTLTAVTGDEAEAVVIWKDTAGAESTDPVLMYLELSAPVTPNGGDIVLQWNGSGLGTIST